MGCISINDEIFPVHTNCPIVGMRSKFLSVCLQCTAIHETLHLRLVGPEK